jgi:HlyD family secretion protein
LEKFSKTPSDISDKERRSLTLTGEGIDQVNVLMSAQNQLSIAEKRLSEEIERRKQIVDKEIQDNEVAIQIISDGLIILGREVESTKQLLDARKLLRQGVEQLNAAGNSTQARLIEAQTAAVASQKEYDELSRRMNDARLDLKNRELKILSLRSGLEDSRRQIDQEVQRSRLSVTQAFDSLESYRSKLVVRINDLNSDIFRQDDAIKFKQHSLDQLNILAPVDGVISELVYPSPGSRISAGTKVVTMLPSGTPSVIVATVASRDVGFVRVGTEGRLKLDAYPYQQYGTVTGEVLKIFPIPEKPEFQVRLALMRPFITINGDEKPIFPGLSGQVDLLTQRQPIYELFLRRVQMLIAPSADSLRKPSEPLH